ncbi:hypothetical protein BBP40_008331 [Aspergillus hancockii]|nr:hypothetical protein BBP40_008331 [Aspergillus hancockii]
MSPITSVLQHLKISWLQKPKRWPSECMEGDYPKTDSRILVETQEFSACKKKFPTVHRADECFGVCCRGRRTEQEINSGVTAVGDLLESFRDAEKIEIMACVPIGYMDSLCGHLLLHIQATKQTPHNLAATRSQLISEWAPHEMTQSHNILV